MDDTVPLVELIYDGDSAKIVEWLEEHIRSHLDMYALLEFLARMIYKTWPMALTKDVEIGTKDFWALDVRPGAPAANIATARIITAALNADWDTLTALIHATLSQPEEFHGGVTAHLLAAFGDGLHAITAEAS
jgi:hypothetical protein